MTKVLVIEDTDTLREDIIQIINFLDYQGIGAADGLVGVQVAQKVLPDLIICDIMMPGLDGYGVFATLHENPETATIPFIFLSAKADKTDIRQGMNLGADDYLCKPFTVNDLKDAIAARLAKQEARRQAERKLKESEEKFRKLAQREELLNRLTKQIRQSLEFKNILHPTLNAIGELLQIHRCRFFWYRVDVQASYFELIDEFCNVEDLPCCHEFRDIPTLEKLILGSNLLQLNEISTDERLDITSRELLTSIGLTSMLAISIKTNSAKLGVILCEQFQQPRHWHDNEVELLQAVTDQLALAIDQAELYAKTGFTAAAAQIQARQLETALSELQHTQSQLIQKEKMSSLGEMVAGIAHEINNPVNFIYGNVNHVRSYVQDLLRLLHLYQQEYPQSTGQIQEQTSDIDMDFILEDLPKVLSSMEMGADRIRQIVLSLRNFSRHDESEMKPVNIHEGIDNTLLILENRLKPKGAIAIQVIKEYGELPLVECYAGQLNQVFMNIIANAIDALDDYNNKRDLSVIQTNPSQILIRTQVLEPEHIAVVIADNGPGIPAHIKERLFDPFFTTKPIGKGTGLGLSISYQIVVQKHNGTIECISEPEQGTAFWIKIPRTQK